MSGRVPHLESGVKPNCVICGKPVSGYTTSKLRCAKCIPMYSQIISRAHARVLYAVRSGRLAHPFSKLCVDCGAPAAEYDHRDYSQPLLVVPVCKILNDPLARSFFLEQPVLVRQSLQKHLHSLCSTMIRRLFVST